MLFRFAEGYSVTEPIEDCAWQGIVCGASFMTEHADYRWMNCVAGVVEGTIDMDSGEIQWRAYECIPEARLEP